MTPAPWRRNVAPSWPGSALVGACPLIHVGHDMRAPPGLIWAADHPHEVKGLVYIEAPVMLESELRKLIAFAPDVAENRTMSWWLLALAPQAPDRRIGARLSLLALRLHLARLHRGIPPHLCRDGRCARRLGVFRVHGGQVAHRSPGRTHRGPGARHRLFGVADLRPSTERMRSGTPCPAYTSPTLANATDAIPRCDALALFWHGSSKISHLELCPTRTWFGRRFAR